MALSITFEDFDTVCYSNQHNIMQLINGTVQISLSLIDIDIQLGNMQQEIDNIPADLEERIAGLERGFDRLAKRLDAVYNFTSPFDESVTGVKITNLEKGI